MLDEKKSLRHRTNMVPHVVLMPEQLKALGSQVPVSNLIHIARNPDEQWIERTTRRIGEWRSLTRTTYIRWALAINGLLLAEATYKTWADDRQFQIESLRSQSTGEVQLAPLAIWSGKEAADNHRATADLLAANGIVDLFGAMEEIVFDGYRIFLNHHPTVLLGGADQKELRQLYYLQKRDDAKKAEWEARWRARLDDWHRKKGYEGLGRVLAGYFAATGLKRPSTYTYTTIESWCETLSGVAELRNLITHGASSVSEMLAEFSQKAHAMTFDFKRNELLVVRLHHLQGVECFLDQLLTAINLSLIEKIRGPLPPRSSKGRRHQ